MDILPSLPGETSMFDNLLESKPQKQKNGGGAVASVILHTLLIVGAVYATAKAGMTKDDKVKAEDVKFVETVKKEPPPPDPVKQQPPPELASAPPPPKGFQVLTAPINIPDKLPDIDLSKSVTNEADFSGKGAVGGTSKGVIGGTGPVNSDQPMFEFQVDKPPLPREGNPQPRFPEMLKSAGIEGSVLATFVVDTSGRAEMSTFKALKSSNEQFTASVRAVLPQMRFYPGETGGRKVKVWVQQQFEFGISKG
ncbi:MAG: energy transducer TonB [Gemmatimonadota bacterium]|nr:energy transducer TonB [Gemmatimonadota bacterium]